MRINKNEILVKALKTMTPKIKKSLLNVDRNEREDLEQEIKLRVIEAVIKEKISLPPTFCVYQEQYQSKNINMR
ncbi:hypothetical protein [Bacillus sp. FJAT-27445]|uniref:hypothetical protein n=1 Tax=Bacillus sp. FJAT-27445 TaxID=1679166 RepID=UPI000743A219|nr:hypothetical protein [Bacillus sp. FJAT-27445]